MSVYKLKIKDQYIDLIKNGKKKHEFRLRTAERRNIKIGDLLVLVSTRDNQRYVKVIVEQIEHFPSWDQALSKYWAEDFEGLYETERDVKKECSKYYTEEQVKEFGIDVFEISLPKRSLQKCSVLLDTNIIVKRESSNNVSGAVMELYKVFERLGARKIVHRMLQIELKKHKDDGVKNNMLEKIKAYSTIDTAPANDLFFNSQINGQKQNGNSNIDNIFLSAPYNNEVDYFITDDQDILKKAKKLFIDDKVMSVNEFLQLVEKEMPSLCNCKIQSIKLDEIKAGDLDDPFFDTLKEDYRPGFCKWFLKKAKEGEKAYFFREKDSAIQGFLYVKTEEGADDTIDPPFTGGKRLKVGTFKVNSSGMRIGERFIKIITDNAAKRAVDSIYVTMFADKRKEVKALMSLMEKWGFEPWGKKKDTGEVVLVKSMKDYKNDKDPKFNYPILSPSHKYGALPIKPEYHTDLFPDLGLSNEDISVFEENPHGYAIEKIYVTKTDPRQIRCKPGDVMLVYRTSDIWAKYNSVVTGYCILEKISTPKTQDEFISECKNRSVFTKDQLLSFYSTGCKTILHVLFLSELENKVTLKTLRENKIIDSFSGLRLSTPLSKEKFDKILKLGGQE